MRLKKPSWISSISQGISINRKKSFDLALCSEFIPGGVLPDMGYLGMCRCEFKGMVFKQFCLA